MFHVLFQCNWNKNWKNVWFLFFPPSQIHPYTILYPSILDLPSRTLGRKKQALQLVKHHITLKRQKSKTQGQQKNTRQEKKKQPMETKPLNNSQGFAPLHVPSPGNPPARAAPERPRRATRGAGCLLSKRKTSRGRGPSRVKARKRNSLEKTKSI